MKSEERTWSSEIAGLVRIQPIADAVTDADIFEKLPQMIALGKYQEIVSICMKYAQQSDPVPAVGFVKQDKKSEANPVKAFCQFILGRLNETVADNKKSAADFYNKAINIKEDANYPGYLFDLGDFLYECVDKYEWADKKIMLESFKKAAELGDEEAKLRLVRMTLSGECKGVYTKKEAKQVVMDFLEKDSGELEDRAGLMFDLAHIYSDKSFGENYESAIEILDDALILSDNDSEILDYKGELLMKLGKEDEIADVWDELLSLYPDYVKTSESNFCKTMKEKHSIIKKTY